MNGIHKCHVRDKQCFSNRLCIHESVQKEKKEKTKKREKTKRKANKRPVSLATLVRLINFTPGIV